MIRMKTNIQLKEELLRAELAMVEAKQQLKVIISNLARELPAQVIIRVISGNSGQ